MRSSGNGNEAQKIFQFNVNQFELISSMGYKEIDISIEEFDAFWNLRDEECFRKEILDKNHFAEILS